MLINSNNVATGKNHADHLCYLQCVLLHVLGAVMADVMLGGPGTGSSLNPRDSWQQRKFSVINPSFNISPSESFEAVKPGAELETPPCTSLLSWMCFVISNRVTHLSQTLVSSQSDAVCFFSSVASCVHVL